MRGKHVTVKCEKCESDDLKPLGNSPSMISKLINPLIREIAGDGYVESPNTISTEHQNIKYKCESCGHKFFPKRDITKESKDFDTPCEISLYREKSFVGALMPLYVYLNGQFISTVNNGKSIQFTTHRKQNVIVITANDGTAFPDMFQFEATSGKLIEVKFKRQFTQN